MISVEEALEGIFALLAPCGTEDVPLERAAGRVLAAPVVAMRDQPPFAASVMDGYALATARPSPGAGFEVVGVAAAGEAYGGAIGPGQAVRIYTGAPLPEGARRVVIQEDVTRTGDQITIGETLDPGLYIRPAGADFKKGWCFAPGQRLSPEGIALLAAMNAGTVTVQRAPRVALIATGDELIPPGGTPGPDQIITSNNYGLAAMLRAEGAEVQLLPIARDSEDSLRAVFELARGADLIVTLGGASVGDRDLVRKVAGDAGLETQFYKVAMRPGKPLMAGRMFGAPMVGLPGNPVSAMVCGHVFLRPAVRALQALPKAALPRETATLLTDLPANGGRAHYMRAHLSPHGVTPFSRQDSALLTVLAEARALLVRAPNAPALTAGEAAEISRL